MKFTELQLHHDLLKGIDSAGYVECTPVQEQVLQAALNGADLYVQSQTGTGKTAAFLISIIQQMLARSEVAGKTALVMVPTRELAVQVEEEARTLISGTSLKTGSFYGGVGYNKQTAILKAVGIQGQGIVNAFLKARQSVAGQPVDEVESKDHPGLIQQRNLLGEFLAVDAPCHQFEDFWMGTLESDLQGAGKLGECTHQLRIQ